MCSFHKIKWIKQIDKKCDVPFLIKKKKCIQLQLDCCGTRGNKSLGAYRYRKIIHDMVRFFIPYIIEMTYTHLYYYYYYYD